MSEYESSDYDVDRYLEQAEAHYWRREWNESKTASQIAQVHATMMLVEQMERHNNG